MSGQRRVEQELPTVISSSEVMSLISEPAEANKGKSDRVPKE